MVPGTAGCGGQRDTAITRPLLDVAAVRLRERASLVGASRAHLLAEGGPLLGRGERLVGLASRIAHGVPGTRGTVMTSRAVGVVSAGGQCQATLRRAPLELLALRSREALPLLR
jgi:hypothetical protein